MKRVAASSVCDVFVDGASRGNPGPASLGVVFQSADGQIIKTISQRIGIATNNVAEYYALIFALQEALILGVRTLRVFTDSELMARQYSGEYKIKDAGLKVLYLLVTHLKSGFKALSVTHVPREKNKLADAAANRALDEAVLF
jgi:ribonuclease HI